MDTSPYGLLGGYCILILLASIVGGLVPLLIQLTHARMQVAISFVAGFMLGVALLVLLPHALEAVRVQLVARWMVGGMMAMFFAERFFSFHHHDVPAKNAPVDGPRTIPVVAPEHRLGWSGAFFGRTLHSGIAGVALAATIRSEAGVAWPGVAVFMAILLHKPFDSLTLGTLMAREGWSVAMRHVINGLFALAVPAGAGLFLLGLRFSQLEDSRIVGSAVAFSAGVFLIISLSDLLPELQFHRHDRGKLSLALSLGIAMAFAVSLFEEDGHSSDSQGSSLDELRHSVRDEHNTHGREEVTQRIDP